MNEELYQAYTLKDMLKRIVYKACGYNDLDYLYLKIRQEGQK